MTSRKKACFFEKAALDDFLLFRTETAGRPGREGGWIVTLLLSQHLADLKNSGLLDETIAACRFYSVSDHAEARRILNWKGPAKDMGPFLAIPFFDLDGKPNCYIRLKPDRPRVNKKTGKPQKYESPYRKPSRAYLPPAVGAALADPTVPLLLTEGEKKAAAASQFGFPCLGLVGVWGWQKPRKAGAEGKKAGPRELIGDLDAVAWDGRTVYVVFDSDLADKPEVAWAEWHLAEALKARGAAVKVVRLPAGKDGAKVGLDDFLVAEGADAFRKLLGEAREAKRPEDRRPLVLLDHEEHAHVEAAVRALAAADRGLYQRGGMLVRVTRPVRPEGSPSADAARQRVERLPPADLRTRLTRHVRFQERKDGQLVESHPPRWLVEGVEALGTWPGIRPLEAVVGSPVLMPDGSVLQTPGYHARSGLLYDPDGPYPAVPERPTQADALKARDALLEIFEDFPFQAEAHRAAAVAATLTPLARFAFAGPSPAFLIDGNIRGAGKGLQADCIGVIALGAPFGRTPYPSDNKEMLKLITSFALEGKRAVLFDNVVGNFGCAALDAALTATEWEGRILGKSNAPKLSLPTTWYVTGNNMVLAGDTGRRACHIRLESPDERPEERSGFRHPDLLGWVRQERGRLLAAALTILSAYCRAGRPDQRLKPWGSYEGWTALVRGAVVWVGLADPGETRGELSSRSDSDVEAISGLVAGWQEIDPEGRGLTVNKALALLKEKPGEFPTLRATLETIFDLTPGKLPGAAKVGYALRKYRGRNVGGRCLDGTPDRDGVQAWKVRAVGGRRADSTPGRQGPQNPQVVEGDAGDAGHVSAASRTRVTRAPEASGETSPACPASPASVPWDQPEADALAAKVKARLGRVGGAPPTTRAAAGWEGWRTPSMTPTWATT
jgi:hypothetical protein